MQAEHNVSDIHKAMLVLMKGFAAVNIIENNSKISGTLYYQRIALECNMTHFKDLGILEIKISRQMPFDKKYVISKETRDYFRITEMQPSRVVVFEKEFWVKEFQIKNLVRFIAGWFKTMLQSITTIRMNSMAAVHDYDMMSEPKKRMIAS